MSRIRIATLLTELSIGGDENRVLQFAQCLDRQHFEQVIISLFTPDSLQEARGGAIVQRYRALGVRCLSLGMRRRWDCRPLPRPLSLGRDGLRTLVIVGQLAQLLERERIDVLDARMNYAIVVGLAAARLARVPAVLATEYYNPFWARPPWRTVAPAIFDAVDFLVSDSRWAIDEYRRLLGRPLANAVVVQNGMTPPTPTIDRARARELLGLPPDPNLRVVAQVGRLVPSKGHRVLLEAAARVAAEAPDVYFLLCGYPGPERAYLAELDARVRTLGLTERVRITPYPGPIGDVWQAVDIHAHASLLDSSPLAIHESMTFGLPAVVTAAGGIPELVQDGVTGLVVPPGNAFALAEGILHLLRDPELGRRLGAAALALHRRRHRPETMTRTLERLMVEALEHRRPERVTSALRLAVHPDARAQVRQ